MCERDLLYLYGLYISTVVALFNAVKKARATQSEAEKAGKGGAAGMYICKVSCLF